MLRKFKKVHEVFLKSSWRLRFHIHCGGCQTRNMLSKEAKVSFIHLRVDQRKYQERSIRCSYEKLLHNGRCLDINAKLDHCYHSKWNPHEIINNSQEKCNFDSSCFYWLDLITEWTLFGSLVDLQCVMYYVNIR